MYFMCMKGIKPIMSMVQWKGGVGKTTLAVYLAAALDAVLIDLEPWGGTTTWWAGQHAAKLWQAPSGAEILRALKNGVPPKPKRGRADRPRLVPSHEQLLALSDGTTEFSTWAWTPEGNPSLLVPTGDGPRPLADALRAAIPTWAKAWDAPVVVDTPAGFGPLADGAVAAADVVILPVTLDQWAVPALRKFMASYAPRIRRGLILPNRVRTRVIDDSWAELVTAPGVVEPPFFLGPPIPESEILRGSSRPLTAGPAPGAARAAVLDHVRAAAQRALELAGQ